MELQKLFYLSSQMQHMLKVFIYFLSSDNLENPQILVLKLATEKDNMILGRFPKKWKRNFCKADI